MKPRHQVSREAMELIKRFEGYRRSAAKLTDGGWTIGYGHTRTAREGVEISEKDAEALLIYDLLPISAAVNDWTHTPLTPNQFDALISFAFNIGLENLRGSSVLRLVNEGALLQAASALEAWRKADFQGEEIVVDALVRRRAAEKILFLTPPQGWAPAPSPVVQPRLDVDATLSQTGPRPTNLIVPLEGEAAVAHEEIPTPDRASEPEPDPPTVAEIAAEAVAERLRALMGDAVQPAADPGSEPFPLLEAAAPLEPAAPTGVLVLETPTDFTDTPAGKLEASREADGVLLTAPFEDDPDPPRLFSPAASVVTGSAASSTDLDHTRDELGAAYDRPLANTDFPRGGRAWAGPPEDDDSLDPHRQEGLSLALVPYVVLGVAGLVLFIGGIFWGVATQSLYVWGASLLGVIFVAASVYYLLERLGGSAE